MIVYFFCVDEARDPVAPLVWRACRDFFSLERSGEVFDELGALRLETLKDVVYFVPTRDVLSHDYSRYAVLLDRFAIADFAGLVNWHEGRNAPDDIFCIHTTGDLPSGAFGPADPGRNRILLRAIEQNRRDAGLVSFRTMTEATHWSGVAHGAAPARLLDFAAPLVDIEIGSAPSAWSNPLAAEALARALVDAARAPVAPATSVLCVGGVHFEPSYGAAMLGPDDEPAVAVSHILANQWLVSGGYDTEAGLDRLRSCVASIRGGVDAIVHHDNLKGSFKAVLRRLAEQSGVSIMNHRALKGAARIRSVSSLSSSSDR
jgi:D-tyrosyl-tRNA(Tyr) deacylase